MYRAKIPCENRYWFKILSQSDPNKQIWIYYDESGENLHPEHDELWFTHIQTLREL